MNFAEVLRETGMPSFMKIDIEGSDKLCLETLLDLEGRPHSVSVESSKTDWTEIEDQLSLLERLGYDRFAIVQQGTIPDREIVTRTLGGDQLTYRFEQDASGPFGSDVGPWMDRSAAIAKYRRIFLAYRFLGGDSRLRRNRGGRILHRSLVKRLGRPVPGWFDTHAARSTDWNLPRSLASHGAASAHLRTAMGRRSPIDSPNPPSEPAGCPAERPSSWPRAARGRSRRSGRPGRRGAAGAIPVGTARADRSRPRSPARVPGRRTSASC